MQCYRNGAFLKFLLDCHHFHADLGCLLLTADLYNKSIVAESMRMKNLSLTNGSCDSFMLELAFRLWVTCFWLLDGSNSWGYDAVLASKLCMNQYAVLCTSISVTKGAGCCQNSTVQTYLPIKLSV